MEATKKGRHRTGTKVTGGIRPNNGWNQPGLCLGWYGQRRSSIHQQPARGRVATAAKPVAVSRLWCAVPVKQRKQFLKSFFKFNWVTGSPPKFDTLLASWYPTYMQSFIISHSSCADQYGDMSADTQTHSHTHLRTHTH